MPYDIIIGRDPADKKKFGMDGLVKLGKGYVTMGAYTSLSNTLWMDVARTHVVLIAGKRGSGKSYTIGVLAEELADLKGETSRNIASLIFDTMGIFWTMKFKNDKERDLLASWDLETKSLPVRVYAPGGRMEEYRKKNIPIDQGFSIDASELDVDDWVSTFNLSMTSLEGTLIASTITDLKKAYEKYTIQHILHALETYPHAERGTKTIVTALFKAASTWGIFAEETGTPITDLVAPGQTTVLDLSTYSATSAFNVRALVIGLVSRKLFIQRMDARKQEEMQSLQHGVDYQAYALEREVPLVWLFVDEAHEFLPRDSKTPATEALVQILREGRQPGISLVLATQQPGQIHKDVMTQSDIVISHKVTSQQDVQALNEIMQSYLLETIKRRMDDLPRLKGSAIILDDNSERLYSMRMRPRFTWHGGEAPTAIKTTLSV